MLDEMLKTLKLISERYIRIKRIKNKSEELIRALDRCLLRGVINLNKLVDGENLLKLFPELKVDF